MPQWSAGLLPAPLNGHPGFKLLEQAVNAIEDLRREVNVRTYGAKGNGVADDTAAIQAAVNAVPYGGRVKIPSGKYKLTDEITLHAGVIIEGDGSADFTNGQPPASASIPSYLFQATAGKAIFSIGATMHAIRITDVALAPTLVPALTPVADGKMGIKLQGTFPGYIWQFTLERVTIYNLHYGIWANDPAAALQSPGVSRANTTAYSPGTQVLFPNGSGTTVWQVTVGGTTGAAPPAIAGAVVGTVVIDGTVTWSCVYAGFDWSVAPGRVANCMFYYPLVGFFVNTNNVDSWVFDSCGFFIPSGGDGAYLYRFGYLRFSNCFAGGASVSSNHFFHIRGVGINSVDHVLIENCQAETLTQFIYLDTLGGYGVLPLVITVKNCIAELVSDVYLGNQCRFVSSGNRFGANVYTDHPGVRISSQHDWFAAGFGFLYLSGNSASVNMFSLIPGADTAAATVSDSYAQGRLTRFNSTIPIAGASYKVGDTVVNTAPVPGAPSAWVCIAAGNPGTWAPIAWIQGSSADNGDTSPTLVASSPPTQRFDTALTANRTVTLPANAACYNGQQFRIVRTGLGAFTLTVQDAASVALKVMPSATAAFADVEYTGTAWKLAAYGAL